MERIQTFLHYGYDRKIYDSCAPDIARHNLKVAKRLSLIFLVIMVLFLTLSVVGINRQFALVYGIETVEFAFTTALADKKVFAERHSRFIVMLVAFALIAFGITASVADTTVVATSFHVMMILVAVFFVTTLLPMMCVLGVGVVGLIATSVACKPAWLASGDTVNAVIFFFAAIVMHYLTSQDRVQNYLNLHELREARKALAIESHFDGLSGLFNRTHFFEIAEALDMTEEYTVCLIDIDNFKLVNDQYGHHTGDLVIAALGAAIRTALHLKGKQGADAATAPAAGRKTFAGRLGGDEFIMLVGPDGPDAHEAGRRVQEIMASTDFGELHGIGVSIGYASTAEYPGVRVNRLYRAADVRMYLEKTEHHIGR